MNLREGLIYNRNRSVQIEGEYWIRDDGLGYFWPTTGEPLPESSEEFLLGDCSGAYLSLDRIENGKMDNQTAYKFVVRSREGTIETIGEICDGPNTFIDTAKIYVSTVRRGEAMFSPLEPFDPEPEKAYWLAYNGHFREIRILAEMPELPRKFLVEFIGNPQSE